MMRAISFLFFTASFLAVSSFVRAFNPTSVYEAKPDDPHAIVFTAENYGIRADGTSDVSDALQKALDDAKKGDFNYGIVFLPEGEYRISKTIHIPLGVRLIGYGKKRPKIVLADNAPGFDQPTPVTARGKYMIWFIGGSYNPQKPVPDAHSSTFYSALMNVDLKIGDGNPGAVAIRAHFAQHCSVADAVIEVGGGKAGIEDAGNHLINLGIYGGDYGISTMTASPGWPITVMNSRIEGQRKASVFTRKGGLVMIRMHILNAPVAVEVGRNSTERLFMEDCIFENISRTGVTFDRAESPTNQFNLRGIQCRDVPVFSLERNGEKRITGIGTLYRVTRFLHGLNIENLEKEAAVARIAEMEPIRSLTPLDASDTPALPPVSRWVSIRDLGARGDGFTDDTEAFIRAIEKHDNIYIPQGWYVVRKPLVLKKTTHLIGLQPGSTGIFALGGNPAFSGFGAPAAQITTPKGGANIVTGIHFNANVYNYRVVNCKWMAGEGSYLYDVKFANDGGSCNGQSGGNPLPRGMVSAGEGWTDTRSMLKRYAWDNHHWNIWVTDGGGGTFRDLWSSNILSCASMLVADTEAPGRIYGVSFEHHMRHEAVFRNVKNWKVYGFQFEEEGENVDATALDLINCENITFANVYLYRTSRITEANPAAIRTWNCRNLEFLNVHNWAHPRTKYASDASLSDVNTGRRVWDWEAARIRVAGDESRRKPLRAERNEPEPIVTGFQFIDGLTRDSKGNIFFCEQNMRRVYRMDARTKVVTPVTDFPWPAVALACDTQDRLIVVVKYMAQPGYDNDDKPNGKPFFGWQGTGGRWGFVYTPRLYSIDPANPEATFTELEKKKMPAETGFRQAFYPANRTGSVYDFYNASRKPTHYFVAQDGVTIIVSSEDLFRCSSLVRFEPDKPACTLDELHQRVIRSRLDAGGYLVDNTIFAERGDRGVATDANGNVYVTNGDIYVYNPRGERIGTIEMPEKSTSLLVSDGVLYVTGKTALYQVKL